MGAAERDGVGGTQAVDRALGVLLCFSDAEPKLRVADVARRLGVTQSTASRLLAALEAGGFVERDTRAGAYQLGATLITLAGIALNQSEIRRQAVAELSEIATSLGLAANLAVLRDDAIFYLATVEGPRAPKAFTMIGKKNPLHCTGIGKVLLAHQPPTEREVILARISYPRFTPATIGSPDELRTALDQIVAQGYASEREELAFGRACLAAPIREASGAAVAALSISGPLSALDLDRRESEIASHVIEAADRVSHNLGYLTVPAAMLGGWSGTFTSTSPGLGPEAITPGDQRRSRS
jgi:DNA-binding IclR family transcriptional regulator